MKRGKAYWGYYALFVGPLMVSYILFFIFPVIQGIGYSFYSWNGISTAKEFIGIKNYISLLSDKDYWGTLGFTFKYAVFCIILTNVFALLMALWVNSKLRTALVARVCFFLPNVLSAVIIGMMWRFIFNQAGGNLAKLTGIEVLGTKILASTDTAWIAILIVGLWTGCGYNMIIYVAGLVSIDRTYYESASIDGASKIKSFFYITLPLMMPSITITLFNTTAGALRMFDLNLSLTGGGPGKVTTGMALDVYQTAFTENRMGYAQAKSVILLVIVVVVVAVQMQFTRKKEVEM